MPLVEQAPAKINLGFHVLRRRPDGDHDVETVLHRIDWADTITAQPADTLSMSCSDPSLPTDETNLCLRAAHRLQEAFGSHEGPRFTSTSTCRSGPGSAASGPSL